MNETSLVGDLSKHKLRKHPINPKSTIKITLFPRNLRLGLCGFKLRFITLLVITKRDYAPMRCAENSLSSLMMTLTLDAFSTSTVRGVPA